MSVGKDAGPFAADTFGLPERNPWNAQMRPTGFDFLPDGNRMAVCTWDGDVWLVTGLLDPAGNLSWQRIASGLFQPLGLKVRDGQIVIGDVMLVSLSFDHRIIDGHIGAAFAYEIIGYLENPDRLFLEMA